MSGSAHVVAVMPVGLFARLRGPTIEGTQVGFMAQSPMREVGAFVPLPGFTYAVTDAAGQTTVRKGTSLLAA